MPLLPGHMPCRFGRKLQMELARKRRAGLGNQRTTQSSLASEGLRARVRETAPAEISPVAVSSAIPAGAFVRGAPGGYVRSALNPAPTMQATTTRPAPATGADVDSLPVARGGWNISREILTIGLRLCLSRSLSDYQTHTQTHTHTHTHTKTHTHTHAHHVCQKKGHLQFKTGKKDSSKFNILQL